jgi:fatty acid-binding protein DegV
VIQVADGAMHLKAKIRGGRPQVLNHLINNTLQDMNVIDTKRIFVTHSEDYEESIWIKNKLVELNKFQQVLVTSASCVISSHCGPKTIGIIYSKK